MPPRSSQRSRMGYEVVPLPCTRQDVRSHRERRRRRFARIALHTGRRAWWRWRTAGGFRPVAPEVSMGKYVAARGRAGTQRGKASRRAGVGHQAHPDLEPSGQPVDVQVVVIPGRPGPSAPSPIPLEDGDVPGRNAGQRAEAAHKVAGAVDVVAEGGRALASLPDSTVLAVRRITRYCWC